MRLIDADKLICGRVENDLVVILSKCAETVDAVPVVRCKDCRWYETSRTTPHECTLHGEWVDPDYYCASGEVVGGAK